jgi:HSP20 family protein
MATPTRRGDRDRSDEQTRQPTAWDSVAAPPTNAYPLAQLRLFNPLVALLDDLLNSWPAIPTVTEQGATTPLSDLEELDDAWLLQVELPGVKKDDIDIQLTGRRLVVHAERKQTERKGLLRRSTRTVGRYFLEIVLPDELDPEGVEASVEDGVLTIRASKLREDQGGTRRIAVTQPDGGR